MLAQDPAAGRSRRRHARDALRRQAREHAAVETTPTAGRHTAAADDATTTAPPRRHDDTTTTRRPTTTASAARRRPTSLSRRVAVLSGGRSSEHEVSVASARASPSALAASGFEVVTVEIDRDGGLGARRRRRAAATRAPSEADGRRARQRLPDRSVAARARRRRRRLPGAARPVRRGRDGAGPARARRRPVRRRRACAASALCMDKDLFKSVLRDHGIPVTRNVTLRLGDEAAEPVRLPGLRQAGPARLVGRHLEGARRRRARRGRRARVRARREGARRGVRRTAPRSRSACSATATPSASLPGEIVVTRNEWYDYEAKYDEGEMELLVPARITRRRQAARAQELAVRAFVATECEGMARVDLFVRERRRGARERAEHDPRLHRDERLREALRGVGHPVRATCSSG